jgi:cytochrome c553
MVATLSGTTRTSRALAAAALLFCMGTTTAQTQAQTTSQPSPGQLALCAACHGAQGNSQIPSIPSLAGQPKTFIENQLVLIREGIREVPQMKGLLDKITDEEFITLANYFAAQTPVKATTTSIHSATYLRGQETAKKMLCGTCHLPNYVGQNQIPRLAGQHEEFLVLSIKQFRDGKSTGRDTNMSAAVQGMKDADVADLAHYLAHFK